jgi:hypothetical protein
MVGLLAVLISSLRNAVTDYNMMRAMSQFFGWGIYILPSV